MSYAESYLKLETDHNISDKAIAIGHYFHDRYRADLSIGEVISHQRDKYGSHTETIDDSTYMGTKRIMYNTGIRYFLFNNYFNLIKKEDYSVFISGGIGYARIKERVSALFSGIITNGDVITIPLTVDKFQTKKNNLIYSLGTGIGIKINKVLNFDVSYNYKDFGKPQTNDNFKQIKRYNVHQLGIGIRFDI